MDKNSKVFKRMNKMKKSNSSISTLNTNKYNYPHRYTYELDKKEENQSSLGISNNAGGTHLSLRKSNKKIGTYSSLNINNLIIYKNVNFSNDNEITNPKDNCLTKITKNKISNFYKHRMAINKIIRRKKMEKLIYYENFYNNLKTQDILNKKNKERLTEDKFNATNVFNVHSKLDSFRSNSISNIFSDMKINKQRNISKTDIFHEIKLEEKMNKKKSMNSSIIISNREKKKNSTAFTDNEKINEKKEYRMFTSNINNNTNNTNNTNNNPVLVTSLPLISKRYKYKHKYSSMTQSSENIKEKEKDNDKEKGKEDINLNNFTTQKLDNYIFESLEDKYKTVKELTKFENKMFHLKYYQNLNKKKLDFILMSDKFNIDKIINHLIKLNKKYNDIWANYRLKINLYLHFLFDYKSDMETNLGIILHQKKSNENMIEKLMIQSVKKQKDLEQLVQTRNFILQVKLKMINQPPYFSALLHRDSRKIELGNIILTSTVGTKNSSVIKFLDSFSFLNLVQLYEIHSSNSLLKYFKKKMGNRKIKEFREKYILHEDLLKNDDNSKYIPKKGEIFFESPDKFLEIFHTLERKNLYLLQRNNGIKKNTSKLKEDFNNNLNTQDEDEKSQIMEEISYRERYLLRIKEKNKYLQEKLQSVSNEELVDNNLYTKKIIHAKANSSFVEMNFFKMINYIKILEGYKYYGVLLLEKLISIVKSFIDLKYGDYTLSRCYMFIDQMEFNNILKLNKKSFNEMNKYKVYDYILQLLKLYFDIVEYVKRMQKVYESDENNIQFMKKRREEVQTMRKIANAKEIRELLEEKRERSIEKIIEKWNKPVNRTRKKIDEKFSVKMQNTMRSKSIENNQNSKNKRIENEISGFILY